MGGEFAVSNRGAIEAPGGKILLNASVSADLFREAVNHGGLNGTTEAILHSDGSFSLGAGNDVLNSGVLEASTDDGDAGYVVLAGERVAPRGTIAANAGGDALAGQVYLEANDRIQLGASSRTEATADITRGKVRINPQPHSRRRHLGGDFRSHVHRRGSGAAHPAHQNRASAPAQLR